MKGFEPGIRADLATLLETAVIVATRAAAVAVPAACVRRPVPHCRPMSKPLRPAPLAQLPAAAARTVRGVLTDIDDTLTTGGAITADALGALQTLQAAGLHVIAITGRPMGWSEPFARDWPIDAIVAENGAVALFREGGALRVEYAQDAATRERNAARLSAAAARVLREVPGARLARDSAGRVTDIAIDHAEFARLNEAQIEQVLRVMRDEGMTATVSSIHINGWYGGHDKLAGARWIVRRLLGRELDAELVRWAYVGDSTNDQLMFGHFPLSVGVANLLDFAAQLVTWPAYLTQGARGAGFAEFARALLAQHSGGVRRSR
jgi:HAD superfamily hydrolase (TIGR01484 family)